MSILRRLLLCALCCLGLAALAAGGRQVVVLITYDGLSLDEMVGTDAFQPLLARAAVGVMNNKTDSYIATENTAATISAGTHAVGASFPASSPYAAFNPNLGPPVRDTGFEYARDGFMPDELVDGVPAIELFARNTGTVPPKGAILLTSLGSLQADNAPQRYTIIPGILGQQLGDAGVGVRVYGNADRGAVRSRADVVIGMNRAGWVPGGDVSSRTLLRDPLAPYGVRTDFAAITDAIAALPDGRWFVVVEAGDGSRAETAAPHMLPARAAEAKRLAMQRCAVFADALDATLRETTNRYRVIVISSAPNKAAMLRRDLLTPVVITGSGIGGSALLTSATTKRPGLIANIDLTPTVLRFFGVTPHPSILGLPIAMQARPGAIGYLRAANTRMVISFTGRFAILIGFVVVVALGAIWALLVLIFHYRFYGPFRALQRPTAIRLTLTALMLVPLTLMAGGGLGICTVPGTIAFAGSTALGLALLLHVCIRELRVRLAVIGLTVAGLLLVDLALGGPLLQRTMLSYDPIAGIRFYGLGNESSGVLLGALLLGIYALLDLRGRLTTGSILLVALVYAGAFVLIGGPRYGADFGGMLSAIPGFGFALVKASTGRTRRAVLLWGAVAALLLLICMLVANTLLGESHIGLMVKGAITSGPKVLVDLATRKWAMNLRLVKSSVWTVAFVSLVLGSGLLLFRPVGIVRRVLRAHPLLNAGFLGIVIGLIAAMLTNDSGVAMAATGMLYLAAPLMLLTLEGLEHEATASATPTPTAPPPQ